MKLNNKGLSLVEVVVYMIASIFIIGYLFSTMSNITRSFSQEKKKTNLQMDGQDAISMLARDIATTGFKHYLATSVVNGKKIFTLTTAPGTYLASYGLATYEDDDPTKDQYRASIIPLAGTYDDDITIFRAQMQDAYNVQTIERLFYRLDTTTKELKRVRSTFPSDGDEYTDWTTVDTLILASGVEALKFFYSEDYKTWENIPSNPDLVNYIQIKILVKSEKKGNIINHPEFYFGDDEDGDSITFTPPTDNKFFYRLYERTVEVPSNGRI